MAELRFDIDWLSTGEADPVLRDTSARLVIQLGDCCLTRNLDTWSKTVRDSVLVSAYPLALWFASSWWRLNFEPLPASGSQPDVDWRMAHELAAANHGYVWPGILFASDGENINLWARHTDTPGQSVNYLCDLDGPRHVPLADFQRSVTRFIEEVLHRAEAVGCGQTDLASLWHLICDDMSNPSLRPVRMLEAQMGFDPEECPESLITRALRLRDETGPGALSELAPIFGRRDDGSALDQIEHLRSVRGLRGSPQRIPQGMFFSQGSTAPWQQGVEAARSLRSRLGNEQQPITNRHLLDLLGLTQNQDENWQPAGKLKVGIAKPADNGQFDFIPRKQHPISKRFELARMVGEYLLSDREQAGWRVESDLSTATQKRQRAFAAEFLCPVAALTGFLDGDYSESALEDAAEHFSVSETTVSSLLANNGYLPTSGAASLPYRMSHARAWL